MIQARHIAESDDAAMSRMEGEMAASQAAARKAVDTLKGLLPPAAGPQLAAAAAALDRFKAINAELVKLSRRNSNVRSLALSLGRKRTVTAECDDILHALEETLVEARLHGHPMTVIEITPFGPGDNDGQRTASVLAAYFNLERTRACRRLVWRRLAPVAAVTWLAAAVTTLLSADTFLNRPACLCTGCERCGGGRVAGKTGSARVGRVSDRATAPTTAD